MIKLNLGCCDIRLEDFINIDISDSPHVRADLIADALDLSEHFKEGTVDEIYCGHLLEHLDPGEAERAIIHWVSLLKKGGKLHIVTPDFRYLAQEYLAGGIPIEDMIDIYVFSYVQESLHKSLWDQESLFKIMSKNGLTDLRIINRMDNEFSPYGVEWQCGATGIKK